MQRVPRAQGLVQSKGGSSPASLHDPLVPRSPAQSIVSVTPAGHDVAMSFAHDTDKVAVHAAAGPPSLSSGTHATHEVCPPSGKTPQRPFPLPAQSTPISPVGPHQ
jgi:hypothetical protein